MYSNDPDCDGTVYYDCGLPLRLTDYDDSNRPDPEPPGTHWRALRDVGLRANSIAHARSEPRLMETYA